MLPQSVALCRTSGLPNLDTVGAIAAGACPRAGRLSVGDRQGNAPIGVGNSYRELFCEVLTN